MLPPAGKWWKPLAEWTYHLDQDIKPAWYNAADCEARTRAALADLAAVRIFDGRDAGEVRDAAVMVRNASVVARGSSRVVAWGSSSVVARESSSVMAWGSSRVEAWESSSVTSYIATRYPLHDLAVLIDRSKAGKVTTRKATKAQPKEVK
jgi:hypothetical protein